MEITDIRMTKRGRFSIYVEGEFACVLHPDTYAVSGVAVGDTLTPHQLERLKGESTGRLAREKALALLSQRAYTARKLYGKLVEYTEDEEAAAAAVARMKELGLVNDTDYARRFAADCLNLRHYSIPRTAQALGEKGIDRELIRETLESLEYDPQTAIAGLVLRKYARYLEDEKGVRKTISALQRLGYRYGDIRAVLENLAEDPAYYENRD